jgi:hypothetical protein
MNIVVISKSICLVFVVSCLFCQTSQAQVNYGRNAASGTWVDGQWIDDNGVTGNTPGAADSVYIGNASLVGGATEPATVNLSSAQTINYLSLGNAVNGKDGTLSILSGGSLFSISGVNVEQGLLDQQVGGTLSTNNLTINGNRSTATVDGTLNLSGGISAVGGSTVNLNGSTTADSINSQTGSNVNLNATTMLSTQLTAFDGTVSVGADTTTPITYLYSGVLNLNSGTLTGDLGLYDFWTGAASQVNQNGGLLDLGNLYINGGAV